MGVLLIDDHEEPTAPGVPRPRTAEFDAAAIEGLCRGLRTYGFRIALLVPELHRRPMPERVRGRLGKDLRELGGLIAETADAIDPRSTE